MKQSFIKQLAFLAIFLTASSLFSQNQITGVVNYHEDPTNPVPSVTVELFDSGDNLIATTLTSTIGEFNFSNVPTGEYFLRSNASLPIGNINLIDASLILQYLFGLNSFNDYEFNAADVNASGNVTFTDYFIVLISYIMQGNPFPTDNWQFEEQYVNVGSRTLNTTTIWATSTGDVEGIWMPGGRSLDLMATNTENATLINNEEIELEFRTNYTELISGFNLNLTYPVSLIEVTDITGPDDNFHFELNENTGVLKVIWLDENENPGTRFFGETLFRIKVKQTENTGQFGEGTFSLLEGGMVLDSKMNQIEEININLPKITTASTKLELKINSYPNPVISSLNLKITSPNDNTANIFIYDLNGRLIQQIDNSNIYKGTQQITLNTDGLTSGHYLYKVSFASGDNMRGRFQKTN